MNIPAIYQIKNTVNGKVYIGSSRNSGSRRNGHFSALRIGNHGNYKLQKDFNLFGESSFEWSLLEILETRDPCILQNREQFWIDTLRPEYNIRKDAINTNWEFSSAESRQSISESVRKRQLGRKQSQEEKDKRANSIRKFWATHPAKTIPPKMRKHLSKINTGKKNPNWGKKRTPEQLENMSKGRSNILYVFKSPNGELFSFKNLTKAPIPVPYGALRNLYRGLTNSYKGWTFVKSELTSFTGD